MDLFLKPQACNFIKKETLTQMFFVNFKNVLKGTFLKTHLGYFKVREGGLEQIANIETNRDKKNWRFLLK